jgi:hypothetical protein
MKDHKAILDRDIEGQSIGYDHQPPAAEFGTRRRFQNRVIHNAVLIPCASASALARLANMGFYPATA